MNCLKCSNKEIAAIGLVLTFFSVFFIVIFSLYRGVFEQKVFYPVLAWHSIYIALYWNKKIKASLEGFEINNDECA